MSVHLVWAGRGSWPGQLPTGIRGYFGYSGCVLWRKHIENAEPRPLRMTFWCTHELQSPAAGRFTRVSIARGAPILIALVLAGCGSEEKTDEDRAADVAKRYVSTYANKEREKCAGTLARGVDPKLCGDLAPLAARINPEEKETKVTGDTATVTVTGAGDNTRLEIKLVKQGDEWKVQRWRGYAVPSNQ